MKECIIILISIVLTACNAQGKQKATKNNNNEMTSEKFDIKFFNEKKNNNEYSYFLDDSTKIQQMQAGKGEDLIYVQYIIPENPKYFYEYSEYYNNGMLKIKGKRFKRGAFKKGVWKSYDKQGRLIQNIDYDKPYKFTFEQLLDLIKKEIDTINLFDENTSIARGSDENGTDWVVTYKRDFGRREQIKINGITGEVIERSHYLHEDN